MRREVIAGIILALIIAVSAPFLASSRPDGLESTAEKLGIEEEAGDQFPSPFPDYSLGGGRLSSVLAMLVGIVAVFILAYVVSRLGAGRA